MKDVAYFTQRVPTYLSQAGYYKQILFDQRNPLMSNELLDYYQKVPNSLRENKKLFFRSFSLAYPGLAAIPYAWAESLEDWGALLSRDTPIRRFMADEFSDEKSGIWEVFDRAEVLSSFHSLASSSVGSRQPSRQGLKAKVSQVAGLVFPKQLDHARAQRSLARVPVTKTLLRIMVLKDWHDRFVSSRG
jgi:hypothetical protein